MAKVDERAAKEELKKRGPRQLYYLYGEEPYKIQNFLSLLSRERTVETYYGDEIEAAEFVDSANTQSLWSSGVKVMVIRSADSITAKKWEQLTPLWTKGNPDCVVVFTAVKADARTKSIQALSKHAATAVIKFDPPDESEAARWATQFAHDQGKKLTEEARRLLVSWSGLSLFDLLHDVQKAALFAGNSEEIAREHVERVGIRVREESIFPVMDAVLSRNAKDALSGVAALLSQREEPLGLVALLAKQYGTVLRILALRGEGESDAEIQAALRLHPFVAKKLMAIGKRLGAYQVIGALSALADADFALKSSREPAGLILTRAVLAIV